MLLPLIVALVSVAVGTAFGFGGRRREFEVIPTFALVASLAVVVANLLPDALGAVGIVALPAVVGVALLPTAIGKVTRRVVGHGSSDRLGLELGYAGLLVHRLGDGMALSTYTSEHHHGHFHVDIMIAIAAHTVPIVALMVMALSRHLGVKRALVRAAGLALASVIGVIAARRFDAGVVSAWEPWITIAVAGTLLHVVAHDWRPKHGLRNTRTRFVDMAAVAAGIALVLIGGEGHQHGDGPGVRPRMAESLLELTTETAAPLLIGLIIAATLSSFSSRIPSRWLGSGPPLRQAIRGAIVGAPLPICACGVLPLAQSLRRGGAGVALVVAFLLATPELGVESFALTVRFLGWPFAIARLAGALTLAIVVAVIAHRVMRAPTTERGSPESMHPSEAPADVPFVQRFLTNFDELVFHVVPWTVVGLVVAAYVEAALPAQGFAQLGPYGLDILVVSAVAVPSYVCAASATPLAAVLLTKGISPGAVMVGLLLGPATNIATLLFLRKNFGVRVAVAVVVGALAVSWTLAVALNAVSEPWFSAAPAVRVEHQHSLWAYISSVALGAVILRSIWLAGLRAWLSSIAEAFGSEGHHHHHDHHHHHHHHHQHSHGSPKIGQ